MKTKMIDGITYDVYTDDDWWKDGDLSVQPGQLIEPSIYFELLSALPPKRNDRLFQSGEPETHDLETNRPLYKTFEKMTRDYYYKYIGLMI